MKVLAHTALKHISFQLGEETMETKQRKKMLAEQASFRVQKGVYEREATEGATWKATRQR